jgi:hypothetical protein
MRAQLILAAVLVLPLSSHGYSVLTHEAIIDSSWDDTITPLLKKRFPDITAEQLIEAHSYAYGGAIIQDMGYYPFGSKLFSDLTHYVRSGDFVEALIRDSEDANEYAFALGALAHYTADDIGHPKAINLVVPELYPKLRAKYGNVIPFEKNPGAHLKTEFGFDVLEIAKGRYAPKAYHDFIGFRVAKPVLERAFQDTYSIEMKDLFKSLDLALGTYRKAIHSIIPEMTKAAWYEKRNEIEKSQPGIVKRKFLFNMSRASYEKEWGREYERPGCGARVLAFLFGIIPKVGPFKALSYRMPDAQSEKLFMNSFNETVLRYREYVQDVSGSRLRLPDRNLDTGGPTKPGTYKLADWAYEQLLEKLYSKKAQVSPGLRAKILEYYGQSKPLGSEEARRELIALRWEHQFK